MSVYSYVCPYGLVRINYSGRFMGHTWITNPELLLVQIFIIRCREGRGISFDTSCEKKGKKKEKPSQCTSV